MLPALSCLHLVAPRSQSAMATIIAAGKAAGKPLLVAGCVPQGDRKAAELKGLSLLGERLCF
jgi:hypothetical protein